MINYTCHVGRMFQCCSGLGCHKTRAIYLKHRETSDRVTVWRQVDTSFFYPHIWGSYTEAGAHGSTGVSGLSLGLMHPCSCVANLLLSRRGSVAYFTWLFENPTRQLVEFPLITFSSSQMLFKEICKPGNFAMHFMQSLFPNIKRAVLHMINLTLISERFIYPTLVDFLFR